jgi:hypothetical protein
MTSAGVRGRAFLLAISAWLLAARQPAALDDMLKRAAGYVADFQKQLSGIVAEETYDQNVISRRNNSLVRRRQLRSDFLLVRPVGSEFYVEFRDVFEVDGRAVRDREERLSSLFLNPPPGAASQLERVARESARYNIGRVERTINTPVLALLFLGQRWQPRFKFTADERAPAEWVIGYQEKARPTIIRRPDGRDLPASGRFWIDPATGAVRKSELVAHTGDLRTTLTVTYVQQQQLGFLVPAEMRERHLTNTEVIDGCARYGRFRQFQVNVDHTIKSIKE